MYCHGASELKHNRFTQFNLSALSKREKSFMSKPPAVFLLNKGSLFYFGGFVIPNKVERDLVYFFTEVCSYFDNGKLNFLPFQSLGLCFVICNEIE